MGKIKTSKLRCTWTVQTIHEVLIRILDFNFEIKDYTDDEGIITINWKTYSAIIVPCQDFPDLPPESEITFFNDDEIKIKNNSIVRFVYGPAVTSIKNRGHIKLATPMEIFKARKYLSKVNNKTLTKFP